MDGFGAKLKEFRETAGLSQRQLAAKAALSQKGISQWEAGTREPTWAAVQKLAAALGVTCEAFTAAEPEVVKPPAKRRRK